MTDLSEAEHEWAHRGAAAAARDLRYVVVDPDLAKHRTLVEYRKMLVDYFTEYIRQLEENVCSGAEPCALQEILERELPAPRRRFKVRLRRPIPEWPLRPPRRP